MMNIFGLEQAEYHPSEQTNRTHYLNTHINGRLYNEITDTGSMPYRIVVSFLVRKALIDMDPQPNLSDMQIGQMEALEQFRRAVEDINKIIETRTIPAIALGKDNLAPFVSHYKMDVRTIDAFDDLRSLPSNSLSLNRFKAAYPRETMVRANTRLDDTERAKIDELKVLTDLKLIDLVNVGIAGYPVCAPNHPKQVSAITILKDTVKQLSALQNHLAEGNAGINNRKAHNQFFGNVKNAYTKLSCIEAALK